MIKLVMASGFLMSAGVLAWIALTQNNFCLDCGSSADSSSLYKSPIQALLVEDLKSAAKNKELPAIWNRVLEVKYLYHSDRIKKALDSSPIVTLNKKGDKRLLVSFYDEPGESQHILVQYSMIDIPSGNTVAEMSRRLKLPVDAKKTAIVDGTRKTVTPSKEK